MSIYFANPTSSENVHAQQGTARIGYIDTPLQGNVRPADVIWCADNGCFGKGFNEDRWFSWLEANAGDADTCAFATAPDVVGDAMGSIARSLPWFEPIRSLGYRVAFVAQDGLEDCEIPWHEFDALFIGGSTEWKLGAACREIVAEANRRGKWVHGGRVNSLKRYQYMEAIGCDSVDGTYLTFGPDTNLPKLLGWCDTVDTQAGLFDIAA